MSFTDDAVNEETLTSEATAAVEAGTNNHDRPYDLQATPEVGANSLSWQDPDTQWTYG